MSATGLTLAALGASLMVFSGAGRAEELGAPQAEAEPLWWRIPGRADIDRAYPGTADRRGISGRVALVCRSSLVTLTGCRVESEEPMGFGFGKAAISASRWFTIAPESASSPRREVRARIDFVPSRRAALQPRPEGDGSDPRRNLAYWNSAPPYNGEGGSKRADVLHLAGRAIVRCRVQPDGKLRDCAIINEDPAGWGFGKGALATTRELRLARKTLDGSPTAGRLVDVPITYNPECSSYPDPSRVEWCAGGIYKLPHANGGFGSQY